MTYIIVANFKMYFSHDQTLRFIKEHDVSIFKKHELVICPSFDSLSDAKQLLQKSSIKLGAQDCSSFESGAYTGQVSARSLREIGCSYCIVGHSETRSYFKLTDNDVAEKVAQLVHENITPIICIGETQHEYAQQQTMSILDKQLKPILNMINQMKSMTLCIAYEPIWSIGTGVIPPNEHLHTVYQHLEKQLGKKDSIRLLYGGSINEKNIQAVKLIPGIQGFLIGKASTDFQELKKIVLSI